MKVKAENTEAAARQLNMMCDWSNWDFDQKSNQFIEYPEPYEDEDEEDLEPIYWSYDILEEQGRTIYFLHS